jgi:hypothetical protein
VRPIRLGLSGVYAAVGVRKLPCAEGARSFAFLTLSCQGISSTTERPLMAPELRQVSKVLDSAFWNKK